MGPGFVRPTVFVNPMQLLTSQSFLDGREVLARERERDMALKVLRLGSR